MIIQYEQAEDAVKELNIESADHYYWDGWTICKFTPNPVAMWSQDGSYNRFFGWGFVSKYSVDQDGLWHIDS